MKGYKKVIFFAAGALVLLFAFIEGKPHRDPHPKNLGRFQTPLLMVDEIAAKEAEIKAAIDAAAEEGIFVTRDEVARMLLEKNQIKPTKNIKPL